MFNQSRLWVIIGMMYGVVATMNVMRPPFWGDWRDKWNDGPDIIPIPPDLKNKLAYYFAHIYRGEHVL